MSKTSLKAIWPIWILVWSWISAVLMGNLNTSFLLALNHVLLNGTRSCKQDQMPSLKHAQEMSPWPQQHGDSASSCMMGCEKEGWSLQVFLSHCSASTYYPEGACSTAAPAPALHAKPSLAAKISTDRCLAPFPQPTVTVYTQTAVYSALCWPWHVSSDRPQ